MPHMTHNYVLGLAVLVFPLFFSTYRWYMPLLKSGHNSVTKISKINAA